MHDGGRAECLSAACFVFFFSLTINCSVMPSLHSEVILEEWSFCSTFKRNCAVILRRAVPVQSSRGLCDRTAP